MAAPTPRMHGISHVRGGPDPIPGATGFTYSVPSLDLAYFTPGGLEGWWRLGEDTTTFPTNPLIPGAGTDWAQDSSGNNLHLTARNVNHAGTGPQLPAGDPLLPTSIVGAYPVTGEGDPAVDDGGLQFNYAYPDTLSNGGTVGLSRNGIMGENQGVIPVGGGWTLSAFVMFTGTSIGTPVLGNGDTYTGGGPASWYIDLGSGATLGVLTYNTDAGAVWSTAASLVIGRWYHLAVTVERLATSSYRRRILLDLNEQYDVTGTAAAIKLASASGSTAITLAGLWTLTANWSSPVGLDEVSLWSKALTDDELGNIYYVAVTSGDTWTSETIPPGAASFYSYLDGT